MQKFNKIIFGLVCLVLFFSVSTKVSAAGKDCECYSDLSKISAAKVLANPDKILMAICIDAPDKNSCNSTNPITKNKDVAVCFRITSQDKKITNEARCTYYADAWKKDYEKIILAAKKKAGGGATPATPSGSSALSEWIVKCGTGAKLENWPAECKDITIFVKLLLQLVSYLFGIIGALALGVFVYGGFVLIISQGNPEKVKQGTGAMINAVIGLAIAFGGYVLVGFLAEILKVKTGFSLFL